MFVIRVRVLTDRRNFWPIKKRSMFFVLVTHYLLIFNFRSNFAFFIRKSNVITQEEIKTISLESLEVGSLVLEISARLKEILRNLSFPFY